MTRERRGTGIAGAGAVAGAVARVGALALLLAPAALPAQAGLTFALRSVSGEETATANADRRGFEFRALYDGAFRQSATWGWRAEFSGVQMQYQKEITPGDRTQVSENGVEFGLGLRGELQSGALTGVYGVAGPVASWRLKCGVSGGTVDCDPTAAQRVGVGIGLGYHTPISARRDVLFELRLIDGVVAGAGSPVVTFGFGLRFR